jgi:hypothetical protein
LAGVSISSLAVAVIMLYRDVRALQSERIEYLEGHNERLVKALETLTAVLESSRKQH